MNWSYPLYEILRLQNKPSDNVIAQTLFHALAGTAATDDSAGAAVAAFVKKAGGDPNGLVVADGSGLSRRNYVSPRNMVAVLRYMYRSANAKAFVDSLPVAGRDGTLKNRMKGTAAEGSVQAKTGYLSGVCCLSGYVTTASGEPLAFSIMLNNHLCPAAEAKAVQDRICEALAGSGVQGNHG